MAETLVFLIAGGDNRQIYAAKKLSEKYKVYIYGFENITVDTGKAIVIDCLLEMTEKADCMILPLPVSKDGIFLNTPQTDKKLPLSRLTEFIKPTGITLGGRFTESAIKLLNSKNIIDYSQREEFSVLNAVPTAEAAVKIALIETGKCLYKSKVLITGFGRISKALAKILHSFCADVTIAARKISDFSWAEIYGYKQTDINLLSDNVSSFDFIFNTVPAPVISENIIMNLKESAFIIDLASQPGGIDFKAAKKYNIKTVHALSLPGIHFPETAGKIIAQTVINILKERSIII